MESHHRLLCSRRRPRSKPAAHHVGLTPNGFAGIINCLAFNLLCPVSSHPHQSLLPSHLFREVTVD